MEYISKERVKEIEREFCQIPDDEDPFIQLIEQEPAADVAPVIEANWYFAERNRADANRVDSYYCSNCHDLERNTTRYCPSCGAKMKNGEPFITRNLKDIALDAPTVVAFRAAMWDDRDGEQFLCHPSWQEVEAAMS